METIRYFTKDALQCFVYEDRGKMGKAAARDIIAMIHVMLSQKPVINMMFGAAPSQNEVLAGLREADDVDWTRINCFHMDEYIGLSGVRKLFAGASLRAQAICPGKLYFP